MPSLPLGLQQAAVHAGRVLAVNEEGSHLCGNKLCVVEAHVRAELGPLNKSRDTCKYFQYEQPDPNYLCCHQPACLYSKQRAVVAAAGAAVVIPNAFHVYP